MGSTSSTILSSIISRLFVSTIMNPMEAFRIRKVNSNKNHQIINTQRALKVTLIRDLTFSAMFWTIIETVRNNYSGQQYRSSQHVGNLDTNAIAGIIGGGFVAGVTTPLDTVKTRIQSGVKLEGSIMMQLQTIYKK